MFTDCPGCARQFRIHAEHLAAANGQVRCGYCGEQFNALERLHDTPLPETERIPGSQANQEHQVSPAGFVEDEPQFDISIAETELGIDKQADADHVEHTGQDEAAVLFNDIENISAELGALSSGEHAGIAGDTETLDQPQGDDYSEGVEELLYQESPRQPLAVRILWGLATFLVVTTMILQAAWFHRDELLLRYPELLPWVKQACVKVGCEVIRHRDISAIKLLNRDVRFHPRFANALLVNATITNLARVVQPYPRIQLTLFDTGGNVIAYREFHPQNYLDDSIGIDDGMPPDFPVHFVLEVTGPTKDAVSFEFRFL